MREDPDVLIIGGGPAGASVAGLVKKYSPHADVVLCEAATYPRHHIGESLVADVNRLLSDLGAYDKVASAGFIPKMGSSFIWGHDRKPWTIEFSKLTEIPGFTPGSTYQTAHTWHVRRDEYDAILVEHAREMGATVLQPMTATVSFGEGNRIDHVTLSDGRKLHPRYVVDASGQTSQFSRHMGTRVFDPELRNIAVYGYFEGAKLDPALSGTWEASRIAVVTIADGWIWYIPLAHGVVSVGVVTNRDALVRRGGTIEEFFESRVKSCSELHPLLADARRVRSAHTDSELLVVKDFCYSVTQLCGPGWALCGDASGFVDPILSIGCYLSHSAASRLAYTLCTLLGDSKADEDLCWRAYEEQVQFSLSAFRRMTYIFYAFNENKETWWWEAKRILRARALPADLEPSAAFLALATGYGINRPVHQEAISDFGANIFDSFYQNLVEPVSIQTHVELGGSKIYRRRVELSAEPWVVPIEGTGKLKSIVRVTFKDDPVRVDGPRARLLLPEPFYRFLERLDGTTAEAAQKGLPGDALAMIRPRLNSFLTGLVNMGILTSE